MRTIHLKLYTLEVSLVEGAGIWHEYGRAL